MATLAIGLSLLFVAGLTSEADAYQMPRLGWLAGFVYCQEYGCPSSSFNRTDPVNVVVYESLGGATAALLDGMNTGPVDKWKPNSCYNRGVSFYAGSARPRDYRVFTSPNGSFSTDDTDGAPVPGYSGCGSGERNHFRYWTAPDDRTVYVAVSVEHRCSGVHCLSSNAFNRGHDELTRDLRRGFPSDGRSFSLTTASYGAGVLNGIRYDGHASVFTVWPRGR